MFADILFYKYCILFKYLNFWGCTLTGAKKAAFDEEKAAAEFLDSVGVIANVWPQAQTKPDGLKNCAVFNASRVRIGFGITNSISIICHALSGFPLGVFLVNPPRL